MAWRTTEADVRLLIDTDDSLSAVEWATAVEPFIDTATALTDYVASQDSNSLLTVALLLQIEKWLSAHFYAISDPQPQEEKTGDASAVHQGRTDLGLSLTHWGQQAIALDVTGCLKRLSEGQRVPGLTWLGYPPSEQTDYLDRD